MDPNYLLSPLRATDITPHSSATIQVAFCLNARSHLIKNRAKTACLPLCPVSYTLSARVHFPLFPLTKSSHQMRPLCGRRVWDSGQGLNGQLASLPHSHTLEPGENEATTTATTTLSAQTTMCVIPGKGFILRAPESFFALSGSRKSPLGLGDFRDDVAWRLASSEEQASTSAMNDFCNASCRPCSLHSLYARKKAVQQPPVPCSGARRSAETPKPKSLSA